MKKSMLFTQVMVLMLGIANVTAQDWPQYLGPSRNSTTEQKGILRTWPETGPEVLWRVNVGIGFGGPAIKDGKVYLLDRDDKTGDIMRCFDLSSGKELWNYAYEAPGSVMFPGSRSVPTVDGQNVYSCGPYGDLHCFDINTHKPVWKKNIWKDYGGGEIPTWAITQCPLVYGNLLIVASQAPEAGVVAYDKVTGDLKWKTPSLGPVGYVSPSVVKISGEDHIVMVTASGGGRGTPVTPGKFAGIAPLTGKILWEYTGWECSIPVPSAVDAGENRILVVGGYQLGALMIRVQKNPDGTFMAEQLFRTVEFGDQTKPPVLYKGYFYAQYGTNNRRDGMSCMSMDGRVLWKTKRAPDFNKGSMILADGVLLATDGQKTLYLVEPDTTAFKPLASFAVLKEGGTGSENDQMASRAGGATQNWAPLALAQGKLLVRDQQQLICVKVAQ